MLIYGMLLASALGLDSASADCPMRPPPLDVAAMRASKEVQSIAVDAANATANMLLKDGSSVRVINMGCQHSGSVARIWIMHPPSSGDDQVWIEEANKLARIAFTPGMAKSFIAWTKNPIQIQKSDNGRVSMEGTGYGSITYSIEVDPMSMAMGSMLTISYSYP